MNRNLELDRLRAIAIIMTVGIHFFRVFFPWSISPDYHHGVGIGNIWLNSWTGVDLFFVISGYIISSSLVPNIDKFKDRPMDVAKVIKSFFIKRFFRIYPLCCFIFISVLIASLTLNHSRSFGNPENIIEAGIAIFTGTFNYFFANHLYQGFTLSPYWSLAVEEQFYLFLPFFLLFTKNNKQRVLIMLLALFFITFLIRPFLAQDNIFYTHTRCDGLIYGCLIYFLAQQEWFSELFSPAKEHRSLNLVLIGSLVVVLSSITAIGFSNAVVIPLAGIISSILVISAIMQKNIIHFDRFTNCCLDYLGSRSFSLYLIHFPMFSLTQEIMFRWATWKGFPIDANLTIFYTVVALTMTAIATELVYQFIERPMQNKGRQLSMFARHDYEDKNPSIILFQSKEGVSNAVFNSK